MSSTTSPTEADQIAKANASGKTPVVFIHGLWLLPSSWDRWAAVFEEAGFTALTPGWPDDPETVEEAKAHPEVLAGKTVGQVADHFSDIIRRLDKKPAVLGHSFGGLLTQIVAGRGLSAASVAIDPAPFRGVLPLPISALRVANVVLHNPRNWNRAVPLSYDQFRYGFANAVSEDEAKVDTKNPERGPLLITSGTKDHTVPPSIAKASFKRQQKNEGVTEFVSFPDRGHALVIDHGWRDVADTALAFVQRFVK